MLGTTAVVAAGGALAAYAIGCPASQLLGRTVFRGSRNARRIALTFDDGPSDWTAPLAEVLSEYSVPATFFVCGRNAERRPEIIRSLAAAGHELGNHTYSHPCLLMHSARRAANEIGLTQGIVSEISGRAPKWFRPPYGVRAPGLRQVLPSLGLTNVLWTVIGNDWKWDAKAITSRVLSKAATGGIICLHDGDRVEPNADRRETVAAVRRIVPELAARGFEFVTVSGLLEKPGTR